MSHPTTRTRTKIYCFCKKCNGLLLVDPRTKNSHMSKYTGSSITEPSNDDAPSNDSDIEMEMEYNKSPLSGSNYLFLTKKLPIQQKIKKEKISDVLENDYQDRYFENDDKNDDDFENDDDDFRNDDDDFDDDEEVNFASTEFDDNETDLPNIDLNYNFTWIILWILQYQQRYKLPNVVIDSLFKFLRILLLAIDENKFSTFPSSLHKAKNTLGISLKIIIKYVACNKCHKLYNMNELLNETEIPTCSFINFPNHSMERFRQKCNNPLIKKIDSNNDKQIFRPLMTFPLARIRQQLTLFFGRKNFEMSCRKWAERKNETDVLFDIYDGRI